MTKTKKPQEIDIEDYLHGSCHLFALALHEELGYEMEFMWDMERWFSDETTGQALVHAYCILPKGKPFKGKYVDASGAVSKHFIESEYDYNILQYETYSKEKLEHDMKTKFLHKPEKHEIKKLREYIRKNIEMYS